MNGAPVEVFWSLYSQRHTKESVTHQAVLDGQFCISDRTVCGRGIPENAKVGSGGPRCRRCQRVVDRKRIAERKRRASA